MNVGIISLGCDKNRVDTENILALLKDGGYKIESDSLKCDILIINTCAFIESARVESIDTILEFAELKKKNLKKLIVAGCLSQKYSQEIFDDLPEADAFVGIYAYPDICKIIQKTLDGNRVIALSPANNCNDELASGRYLTTPNHYAYLKIADGCNNACSYCTIPSIRGKYRSKGLLELVNECATLNNGEIKEIILVAQDVTRYGFDLCGQYKIVELIQEISKIDNIKWIRLLYCYPELTSDALITEIKNNSKVCKYIDIPFQHISDNILKKMLRRSTYDSTKNLVEKLRTEIPDISLRSTFITGFPGETEDDFNLLYNFVDTYKLENAGFFKYSKEDGTPAAKMSNQVPEEIKNLRLEKLYKLQQKIIFEKNKSKASSIVKVLCDGLDFKKGLFFGRSQGQAPDIDTVIYLSSKNEIRQGEFYNVRITKAVNYDLYGEIV